MLLFNFDYKSIKSNCNYFYTNQSFDTKFCMHKIQYCLVLNFSYFKIIKWF